MARPARRLLLGPHLDVAQGLGDFLRLRLEIFGEHIEAPSDDTRDHPQDHQQSEERRHRGARVLWCSCPSPLRSEEHTSELQSLRHLVCRLLLEKKNKKT